MATFILICRDKPDALHVRMATREAHLAWVGENMAQVWCARGRFWTTPAGWRARSSSSKPTAGAEVEAFTAADPYAKAGLFESVEILSWRQTVGAP